MLVYADCSFFNVGFIFIACEKLEFLILLTLQFQENFIHFEIRIKSLLKTSVNIILHLISSTLFVVCGIFN